MKLNIEYKFILEKFRYIQQEECFKEGPNIKQLFNIHWDICVRNEDRSSDQNVYSMKGDSGKLN